MEETMVASTCVWWWWWGGERRVAESKATPIHPQSGATHTSTLALVTRCTMARIVAPAGKLIARKKLCLVKRRRILFSVCARFRSAFVLRSPCP